MSRAALEALVQGGELALRGTGSVKQITINNRRIAGAHRLGKKKWNGGMAEYFLHEIAKWNVATDDLPLELEAAYHRVVSQIRLYERPLANNARVLAGMWRCNERKAARILGELIEAGKLTIEDGLIVDEKAVHDASTLRQKRIGKQSAGRRGGIESGKSRRKSLKNNNTGEAPASTREEKRREDKSLTDTSYLPDSHQDASADAPALPAPPPPVLREDSPGDLAQAHAMWNEAARVVGWPAISKMSDDRRRKLMLRLKEVGGLGGWAKVIRRCAESDFLVESGWFGFDWLMKPANWIKVQEGNYDRKNSDFSASRGSGNGGVGEKYRNLLAGFASSIGDERTDF